MKTNTRLSRQTQLQRVGQILRTDNTTRLGSGTRAGLTLLEVMLSLMLISTILLVTITASANLFRDQTIVRTSVRGYELAGVLLDEVSVKHFRDTDTPVFGLESDEDASNRSTFDDVDDYHNYVMSPPAFRDGTEIPGFDGWSANFSVQRAQASASGLSLSVDDDSPLRLVTVTCTAPSGASTTEAIAVSEAASPGIGEFSHAKQMRMRLRFSADRNVDVSVPLRNLPEVDSN